MEKKFFHFLLRKSWVLRLAPFYLNRSFQPTIGIYLLRGLLTNRLFICPGVNFTIILQAAFLYESVLHRFYVLTVRVCIFVAKGNWQKKAAHIKCWWNRLQQKNCEWMCVTTTCIRNLDKLNSFMVVWF